MSEPVLEATAQKIADATSKPPFLYKLGVEGARKVLDDIQAAPVEKLEVDEKWITVAGASRRCAGPHRQARRHSRCSAGHPLHAWWWLGGRRRRHPRPARARSRRWCETAAGEPRGLAGVLRPGASGHVAQHRSRPARTPDSSPCPARSQGESASPRVVDRRCLTRSSRRVPPWPGSRSGERWLRTRFVTILPVTFDALAGGNVLATGGGASIAPFAAHPPNRKRI